MSDAAPVPPPLRAFVGYFVWLGTFGFGGPIALAGAMQRDLVERRRWLREADYLDGLALAQLAPGPLAAQLAIYIGWIRGGIAGATLVGLAFVAPSLLMVLAIAAIYVRADGLPWMQEAFYGVGAAVIAIIARGAYKLATITLARDRLLWSIFAVNAAATAALEAEFVSVILLGGVAMVAARSHRAHVFPSLAMVPFTIAAAPTIAPSAGTLFWFFAKAGAFVFGSGLAIVPFLYGGVVREHAWLSDQQFLDAVAVAMITPGPVVITVAFIGYLAGGLTGALASAFGVFLPCWLFVVIPAPYYSRIAREPRLRLFVNGVTAGAAGAIAGAAFVLARRAIVDVPSLLIAVSALMCLIFAKRIPEPLLIVAAAAVAMWIRT